MNCKWLPELIICDNWALFEEYDKIIYNIFHQDFIASQPLFETKTVKVRFHPYVNGKENTYYHITSKDYHDDPNNRIPDPRRCERIKWVRKIIENYLCSPTDCMDCTGIKYWEEPYKTTKRIYLLFDTENYVVIMERRTEYILLITAYYLDYTHAKRKLLKKYQDSKAKGA